MPENLTDYEETRLLNLSIVAGDFVGLMATIGSDAAGGTEVAGGTYGRAAAAFGTAVGDQRASNAPHLFLDMPATEIQGWAIFTASVGGSRKWYGLFNAKQGTADAASDTITSTAHGLVNDDKIVFQSGFTPPGLTAATTYFVVTATSDTFQVATTIGGAAVDITADAAVAAFGSVVTANAGEVFAIPSGQLVLTLR